jgi:three-Cys-motif partner protein
MQDDDGLPLDEVGPWAKEKHARLRKYVDITRAVRRKFLQLGGGATYIDIYCGSGRAIIRDTGEKIDGSPLVAFNSARDGGVPFSELHIADSSEDSCRAAERRIIRAGGRPTVEVGPAEVTAARIVNKVNPYGLHFVFLDPYNLHDLPFSVIEAFSKLKRIDMLIHVSAQDLQRNLDAYSASDDGPLDRFAPGWRQAVDLKQTKTATRAAIIEYWVSKIEALGLPPSEHAPLVTGPVKNQRLYWLVFASRHKLAKEFWDKIRNVSGQGELSW